jgi:pimeloyl-ACP methyl ester carboxylesterase
VQGFAIFAASQAVPVAIAFAAAYAERVTRLVLHGGYTDGRLHRQIRAGEMEEETALALIRAGWGRRGSAFLLAFSTLFVPDVTPEQIDDLVQMQLETASPETAVALRQAVDGFRVTELLGRVQAPTLVLHAEHDAIQPAEQSRKIATGIAGARFVTVGGGNHMPLPQTEAWAEMMDAAESFLAEI